MRHSRNRCHGNRLTSCLQFGCNLDLVEIMHKKRENPRLIRMVKGFSLKRVNLLFLYVKMVAVQGLEPRTLRI